MQRKKVIQDVWKFDIPFLGDKFTMENTIKTFEEKHPELTINYIYTGPDELNSKEDAYATICIYRTKENCL